LVLLVVGDPLLTSSFTTLEFSSLYENSNDLNFYSPFKWPFKLEKKNIITDKTKLKLSYAA
jgi:hypothetical protein